MTDNTWGRLWRRAAKLGLRIDQLGGHRSPALGYAADEERFWLMPEHRVNWVTTAPGRTLDEIAAELDEREAEVADHAS